MTIQGEFEVVTGSDPASRYRYFLNVIIDTSEVWAYRTKDGGLFTVPVDGREVIPLFARRMFIDDWARRAPNLVPIAISLDEFVEGELVGAAYADALVSVMPTGEDWGYLIEIPPFTRAIRMELDLIT